MDSSDNDERDEVKPLVGRETSLANPRRRSSAKMDARSIEQNFNRDVRPSLVGSGSYTMALSWEHLNVSVKIPGKKSMFLQEITPPTERQILKNVSGTAAPGSLVAIIGASGSGKTTFLNVLTNRNTKDYITTGTFRLNGVEVREGIKQISAYVQQNDLFISTLTVREHLQFRALLRMDRHLDRDARLKRVEEVILEIGLTKCADNRIGNPGGNKKGISGGEKKRLSFASEALTGPSIFFLDEPTSSLDSFMAQTIVHTLQNMARKGATIMCTIHQPSSELFAMFSKIILLSQGRVAFMGESTEALHFFEKAGYLCPENFNPADHYILTLAIEPGSEDKCRRKTEAICDAFEKTTSSKNQLEQSTHLKNTADDVDMAMVVMALLIGLIYMDQSLDQSGVQNINGAIFIVFINISLSSAFSVLSSLPEEIQIIMREYGTGLYRLDTYFTTKSLTEMPLIAFSTALGVVITYWMIGLNSSFGNFMEAMGVIILISIISATYGYFISILTGDTEVGLSVLSPSLMPMILFAGLFLTDDSIPDYFIWIKYISWFKYGYEILLVNQWENINHIDCGIGNTTVCFYRTGQDVLDMNSMDLDSVDEDLGMLCVIFAALYAISFVGLVIRGRKSRE